MAPERQQPPQHQDQQPGRQDQMNPQPKIARRDYKGSDKLKDKVALITGGDSGIGQSTALLYAREGADVAIVYLAEDEDAQKTRQLVEGEGRRFLAIKGDVGDESFCRQAVDQTVKELGKLDILVNNAAEQHLKAGSSIINTTSVTAYKGSPQLLDYSSTKGAIVAFTRSLSQSLAEKYIRVNGVAPGPIWTPLIPSTFDEEKVEKFGGDVPLGRAGQPEEVSPCYVFLASDDASYMTGQVLHPNGGSVVNG
jgi:NAD(P)-dependent dehydrogenase (short-subunit alcohol dehydrogenase family)